MRYNQILFDLDGTITNPESGITNSVKYALLKFDIQETDAAKLVQFIGPPLQNSFMEFYGFSKSDSALAVDYYREYYNDKGIYENELYPGINDLLSLLKDKNCTIVLATSKPQVFSERILDHFKIGNYFDYVLGSNLDGSMTDKTEIIKNILEKKMKLPEETIMIGDRKHDIIGAKNNRIDSIGVGYGFGTGEELKDIEPTFICNTVRELYDFFV